MLQLLKPFQDFGQQKLMVEVGSSDSRLEGDRAVVRNQPAALAVMIGRSMMEKTKADFAVVNAGGVRDSLPAGKITYKDVLTVHPFGNTIAVVDLSGKEVMDYLGAIAKISKGSGGFPQFAGIRLVVDANVVVQATVAGKAIDPNGKYRVALNNFVAAGGDGYPKVVNHPSYVDTGFVDADVLRGFIAAHSPLKAADYQPGDQVVRR
jgi:5'-nucleotidase/UDP-sugar diphosphatase